MVAGKIQAVVGFGTSFSLHMGMADAAVFISLGIGRLIMP